MGVGGVASHGEQGMAHPPEACWLTCRQSQLGVSSPQITGFLVRSVAPAYCCECPWRLRARVSHPSGRECVGGPEEEGLLDVVTPGENIHGSKKANLSWL